MNPFDVISLIQAKSYLVMEGISDRDAEIRGLIETSISLVERYTCYRLYERPETFIATTCHTELNYYPVAIESVKNSNGDDVKYTSKYAPLSLNITVPSQSIITATVGYDDVANIPSPLISAAYKMITYLFENKDAYSVSLPMDVQLLLNQFRRSPSI